ncbi:hypothetical protein [Bacillus sp. B1-b2]|uniref:hypothetical protein n=1 Tax=Bacillus sp. B1-b2 TaxID=2653201 RepID=UPI001262A728|nr:hypothetical protein [Bacillus sp. B1-b2]KAB7667760.1 hypothetical protein F9279_14650 [Bacillus sp. B1-b2]
MSNYLETEYEYSFLEEHLPSFMKQMELFTQELKRCNDLKESNLLKIVADELARYDYQMAQVLDVYSQQRREMIDNFCTECNKEKVLEVVGRSTKFIKAICPDCGERFDLIR